MTSRKDFDYVNRKKILRLSQEYLINMVNSLNSDKFFKLSHILFSGNTNNYHFVERFCDRDLDILEELPKFYQFILQNRCQIVYFSYLEDGPKRLELEIDNTRLGLTSMNKTISFRTIFKKYENRYDGSISNMIISNTKKYYE